MADMPDDNHAILLTAPGSGAIAVVRLTGPATTPFLQKYFSGNPRPGRCVHAMLRDQAGQIVDDPVVVQPSQNQADLNLHGGPWIIHQVFELARQIGFQVLESLPIPLPGQAIDPWPGAAETTPSRPAIEHDLLTHLPLARTELALRLLLAQPQAWASWEHLDAAERRRQAANLLADRALWWLLHPPRVAIVGAPNVGKSTLANQLFAQERSIVADLPGTTRDWVGELANINDLPVMLVDTPGRRVTDDPIERQAIDQSRDVIQSADLIVHLLDAGRPIDDSFDAGSIPVLRVANKQDRRIWEAQAVGAIPLTATTGQGLDALRQKITQYFDCHRPDLAQPRWWTLEQQAWLKALAEDRSAPEIPQATAARR